MAWTSRTGRSFKSDSQAAISARIRRKQRLGRYLKPYGFIAPYLVLFVTFLVVPIFYAAYMSLFQQRGVHRNFVGLDNYFRALTDPNFLNSLQSIGWFLVLQLIFLIGIAIALALFIDADILPGKAGRAFRIIFFAPYAVPAVIGALMWGYLLSPSIGPFAQLAVLLGFEPIDFFSNLTLTTVNMVVWRWAGYNMVLLLTALTSIPRDVIESARMDGASGIRIGLQIKLPMIKPMVVLCTVLTIIGGMQLFDEPTILRDVTTVPRWFTPNLYIYNVAFSRGNFGMAATISFLLAIVTMILAFGFRYLVENRED